MSAEENQLIDHRINKKMDNNILDSHPKEEMSVTKIDIFKTIFSLLGNIQIIILIGAFIRNLSLRSITAPFIFIEHPILHAFACWLSALFVWGLIAFLVLQTVELLSKGLDKSFQKYRPQ